MRHRRLAAVAGAGAIAFVVFAAATCGSTTTNVQSGNEQHGISTQGQGTVHATPDVAQVTLGVSVLDDSVAAARDRAAASLNAMIDSLKANGVADKDIQTQYLSVSPEYDYTNGRQLLKGFRVQNSVTATVRDIGRTSKAVDDAITAGGDDAQVQGIAFTIDKPESLQDQARQQAVADARARAETLAKASGVSLGDPIQISESGGPAPVPVAAGELKRAADASTPIQPGELDVTVNVSVTWEIK
ncbi:MAG TPA: SIMPL domain-containing protein [Dehalococcoidia bacterium]|nr:SIMPL domain-containing protein [Dehalococcoidia bacterium]